MKVSSILGKMNGKIGNMVMSSVGGEVIAREYNPNVSNPSTEAQVDQRAKMKLMSQIAAALAPVIVIPKEGLKSSRNLFIKKNFSSADATSGVAQVTYENLQLTNGNAGLPAIHVLRNQSVGVQVNLEERADGAVDRVVYILYKKTSEQTLQYVQSIIAEAAGADGQFPASLVYTEGDIVVFAYGMKDLNAKATAKYSDYEVVNGLDVARLSMARKLSMNDFQFTQTRGTSLFSGESESVQIPDGYARLFLTAVGPGTVSGAGVYQIGESVQITATPNADKYFLGWKVNGSNVYIYQDSPVTIEIEGTTDLIAVFADTDLPENYAVDVQTGGNGSGTTNVTGVQLVTPGESVHLVATPGSGQVTFDGWFLNSATGTKLSSSTTFDYVPQDDCTIIAVFSEDDD